MTNGNQSLSIKRWALGMLFFCCSGVLGFADQEKIRTFSVIVEARVLNAMLVARLTEQSLRKVNLTQQIGHNTLKKMIEDIDYIRSILVLDHSGKLEFDSFNGPGVWSNLSVFQKDLSQREYFKQGMSAEREMNIHQGVVGKQSGLQFVPLTYRTRLTLNDQTQLIVLTIAPEPLMSDIEFCNLCGTIIMKKNKVLMAKPALTDIDSAIAERVPMNGDYGSSTLKIRNMKIEVHWRKSKYFDMNFIYYQAIGLR